MSLTLQFVPYADIEDLSSEQRIKKVLDIAKKDKIVLLEGRLSSEEESQLIKATMESISKKFKGIELSVVYPDHRDNELFGKLKSMLVNLLLGDRSGITIIGPANIVKEIKQDPDKIQLLTQ